jgi:hypothetical protein
MSALIDFFLHAENHLRVFIEHYGVWVYALLFAIVVCETGLVVTPFLPGDSLLFAVGALAAQGMMDVKIIAPLLFADEKAKSVLSGLRPERVDQGVRLTQVQHETFGDDALMRGRVVYPEKLLIDETFFGVR